MQMEAVRFLIEERGAEVNQRVQKTRWTPLMRCAQMAHYTNPPYMQANPWKVAAHYFWLLKGCRFGEISMADVHIICICNVKKGDCVAAGL